MKKSIKEIMLSASGIKAKGDSRDANDIQKLRALEMIEKHGVSLSDLVRGHFDSDNSNELNEIRDEVKKLRAENQKLKDYFALVNNERSIDPNQKLNNTIEYIKETYRNVFDAKGKSTGDFKVKRCKDHAIWGNACIIERAGARRILINEKAIYYLKNGEDIFDKFPDTKKGEINYYYKYRDYDGELTEDCWGLFYDGSDTPAGVKRRFEHSDEGLRNFVQFLASETVKYKNEYKKLNSWLDKQLSC